MSIFSALYRPNLQGYKYTRALFAALAMPTWTYDAADTAHLNDEEAWWKVNRDAAIKSAIENRRTAVAGLVATVTPASDAPADKLVAQVLQGLVDQTRHFWRARYNLTEAIFRGSSFALIVGERRPWAPPGGAPGIWWVPTRLHHVDRWRFRIARRGDRSDEGRWLGWELFSVARQRWEPLAHPSHWVRHFYERSESDLGYGRGLLAAIFPMFLAKEIALSQGLMAVERWAQGLVVAKIDGLRASSPDSATSNEEVRDAVLNELMKHRSEHAFALDKEDDVSVQWPNGSSVTMALDVARYCDQQILRLIQQGDLTTGQGDSGTGSYAQAETQAGKEGEMFAANRGILSEDLTHDWLACVYARNRSALAAYCRARGAPLGACGHLHLGGEASHAPEDVLQVVQAGVPLKRHEAYERLGFEPPGPGDELLELRPPGGAPGGA